MTTTLGLQFVGASKLIVNIPTEATAAANLVNIRPPFQCTVTGCTRHLNKTMRESRNVNPSWVDPKFCSQHFRYNHSTTTIEPAAADDTETEDRAAVVTEETGDLNGEEEVTPHDLEENGGDSSAGTSESASSVSAAADTGAWTADETVCLLKSATIYPSGTDDRWINISKDVGRTPRSCKRRWTIEESMRAEADDAIDEPVLQIEGMPAYTEGEHSDGANGRGVGNGAAEGGDSVDDSDGATSEDSGPDKVETAQRAENDILRERIRGMIEAEADLYFKYYIFTIPAQHRGSFGS
jgi:hypothetical protein